jgi:molybdenum cofactor biosynthesis enzyme MoaA
MGCLNSNESFSHWFGNIHLSGPCNRSCYFCIGQHMQSLESLNSLDTWPMPNIEEFFSRCESRGVKEVNLTGSNTDPLLFKHLAKLAGMVKSRGMKFGIRTNGATNIDLLHFADKASVSIHSFDTDIYRAIMGSCHPPTVVSSTSHSLQGVKL